jgi:hypothetical protein
LGAAAIGLAYLAANLARLGWPIAPEWRLMLAWQWLWWAALAATLSTALLARAAPRAGWIRTATSALLAAAMLAAVLNPYVRNTWSPGEAALWLVGLWMATVGFTVTADRFTDRSPPALAIGALLACGMAGGVLTALTGSLRLAESSVTLTAALGIAVIATLGRPNRAVAVGVTGVAALLLAGLWCSACFFSELPKRSALGLALLPTVTGVGWWAAGRWRGVATRVAAVTAAMLVPIGLAAWPAMELIRATSNEY